MYKYDEETETYFDSVHPVGRVKIWKEKVLCRIPMLIGILFVVTLSIVK